MRGQYVDVEYQPQASTKVIPRVDATLGDYLHQTPLHPENHEVRWTLVPFWQDYGHALGVQVVDHLSQGQFPVQNCIPIFWHQ